MLVLVFIAGAVLGWWLGLTSVAIALGFGALGWIVMWLIQKAVNRHGP